jgi:hypothetical protein
MARDAHPTINPTFQIRKRCDSIEMDITDFVVSGRDQALLYGGYGAYRAQVSKRLHSIRKRLGQTTKKGAKYTPKAPVTAVDIASNKEYVTPTSLRMMY